MTPKALTVTRLQPGYFRRPIFGLSARPSLLVDVARGITPSVPNTFSTFVASNLTDGDDSTFWNGTTGGEYAEWWSIDLGRPYLIERFASKWASANPIGMIQASSDNSTWITRATHGVQNPIEIEIPPTYARYWRWIKIDNTGNVAGIYYGKLFARVRP